MGATVTSELTILMNATRGSLATMLSGIPMKRNWMAKKMPALRATRESTVDGCSGTAAVRAPSAETASTGKTG